MRPETSIFKAFEIFDHTRFDRACSLVHLRRQRPSLCNSQVGSCNYFFGACSAFTRVMACTLTESPSDPLYRKLRQLRCRSEEHTSELQSLRHLVCRLL